MVMTGVCGCTMHCKGHRLKIGCEGLVGYVASTGQMRYAPDVRNDPYYIGCEPATLSEVAIPLRVGEKLVGVFTASHHEVDAFPRQQLRILQALCDHVAVAMQNARQVPVGTCGTRRPGPRGAGSARDSAGAPSEEFAIYSWLCDFRSQCSGAGGGRRLVRLHSLPRRALGARFGRCFWQRNSSGIADVGDTRGAAFIG